MFKDLVLTAVKSGRDDCLSIERSNQSRSLMSTGVLVNIVGGKLLMGVVVVLGCLGEGRVLGWLSELTKDRGGGRERILSLLLLQLLQLCEVERIRGSEMTVGVDCWRRRHGGTGHVSRVTVRSLVRIPTSELGGGRGGKKQLLHHLLILIHIVRIAISPVSVVEIGLINAILSGPVRVRGDAGASAPIAHDRIARTAGSPVRPLGV